MNEGVSVVLRGCDQLRSSSTETAQTPSTTTTIESVSELKCEATENKSESEIEENENRLELRRNEMDNCRNEIANEFIVMENNDESMNLDMATRMMAEITIVEDNFVKKNNTRSVSFPSNDNELVTGYLEPANPWQHAYNVKVDDIISLYKKSCIHHNTEPLKNVIEQLKSMEITQTRISELCLKHENLDRKHCEPLEEIFKRLQFNKIDLEAASLDDESAETLFDMFEYYESARHINISNNCNIGARGWQSCAQMLKKMLCLEQLDAKDIVLTQQHLNILRRPLQLVSHLKILKLENCNLAGRAFVMLVSTLKLNNGLKELYLADNHLDKPDGVMLGSLLKANHHLQLLDVSNNNLQDAGAHEILSGLIVQANDTPSGNGLSVLIMWNNHLTKELSGHFADLIGQSKSLETLNIGKNSLGDEFLEICKESLMRNNYLLQLGLQSTGLIVKSVMALAEIIERNATLQRIDLRDNNIQLTPLTFLSLALKKNTTVTQIDLDDTAGSKSQPLIEQYGELVGEIRGYCARNEEPKSTDSSTEESTSSPQQRSRLSSCSSRKISLTCQTLPRTPPTMATSASGITTANDIYGRTTLMSESKRTSGGRLRSPAPSPIPSPVASPIPSPSRSRFVVSRVSEQTLNNSNNSSTSSSPITTPSPLSVSPTCLFSSTTGVTNSRFRVTIVEPTTPPSSLSSSPVSLPVNNVVTTSSSNINITVGFHCHDESKIPKVDSNSMENCENQLDNTKSNSSCNSNELTIVNDRNKLDDLNMISSSSCNITKLSTVNDGIELENSKLNQSSCSNLDINELSIVNDQNEVENLESIHRSGPAPDINVNMNTNCNNEVRIEETNRICVRSDELNTQELLEINNGIELVNLELISSPTSSMNESTVSNIVNKAPELIQSSSSSSIPNENINSNHNRESEKIDSNSPKRCKSLNLNDKIELDNAESSIKSSISLQCKNKNKKGKSTELNCDNWEWNQLSDDENESKNIESLSIGDEESTEIVEENQARQHTTSLEKLLELFQHPGHLFTAAFVDKSETKNSLHRSMSSLIGLGDKFQQYLRDGRVGTDNSKQNESNKRLTSSETELCSSRSENDDFIDQTTNFHENESDINVPVNYFNDNSSNVPELLLIDDNNSSSIDNASNSNLGYVETFNNTLNNDVNELCDSSGTNCSINLPYSYENNSQYNIISDINNVNIVNNTDASVDNVNSEIFNVSNRHLIVEENLLDMNCIEQQEQSSLQLILPQNHVKTDDSTQIVDINEMKNEIKVELDDKTKQIDEEMENIDETFDDDINSILTSILDMIPYELSNQTVNDDKQLSDYIETREKLLNFNEKSSINNNKTLNEEPKYHNNELSSKIDEKMEENIKTDETIENNPMELIENICNDKLELIDTINSKQTDKIDENYSFSWINNETTDLTMSNVNSSTNPIDNNSTSTTTTTATTTTTTLIKDKNTEEISQLNSTTMNLITNDNNYDDKLLENNYSDSGDVFTDDLIFNIADINIRDGPISSDQSIMFEHNSETSSNIDTLSENPSSSRDSYQGSIDSGIDDLLMKDKRNVDSKIPINIPIINDNDYLSKDKTIENIMITQNHDDNKLPTDLIHITTDNANTSNDIVNSTCLK